MKIKPKQVLGVLAVLMLVMMLAAACSKNSESNQKSEETEKTEEGQEVLKVDWWGNEGRQERTLKAIAKFEEKYPHIKVEWEDAPNSTYWINIAMKTADQNMADVIQMDYKYIDEFVKRKLLLPLDDLIQQDKIKIDDMDVSSVESGTVDGGLYGIVTGVNAQSYLYDPALLAKYNIEPPGDGYTYEDLLSISRKLKEAVGDPGFYPIGSTSFDFSYYLRQRGASMYNAEGTGLGYSDDQLLTDFLTMQNQFIQEELMAPDWLTSSFKGEKEQLISRELAAFHSITSNNVIGYTNAAGKPFKLMPLPSYEGGQEGNYVKPSMFFSISSYTKQSENAALFIDFFLNDTSANEDLRGERGVPAVAGVREHLMSILKEEEREQYLYMEKVEQQSSPIDPPAPLVSGRVGTVFSKIEARFKKGEITASEAAAVFREETAEIFAN
ncbi:ABC transporter substrate-binding protein [Paenibacillus sp. CAU 1782]